MLLKIMLYETDYEKCQSGEASTCIASILSEIKSRLKLRYFMSLEESQDDFSLTTFAKNAID